MNALRANWESTPDHMHILVGFRPSISISDFVRDIKSVSSNYIHSFVAESKHRALLVSR
ncbi:MAG: transposase [Clostridiales bacterium]|nr:transposase [Clostridiales bacterium]